MRERAVSLGRDAALHEVRVRCSRPRDGRDPPGRRLDGDRIRLRGAPGEGDGDSDGEGGGRDGGGHARERAPAQHPGRTGGGDGRVGPDVGEQGDDDLRVRHLRAAEDGDGGRRGDELRVRRGGEPRERDEPGHGDGGGRQEREVQVHGSGPGARADGRARHDDVRVRSARPADQPRGPGRDENGHGDMELRPGERQGAAGEPRLRRHGVLGDVRVQPGRAAGGDDDDYPGREYDRDARREPRLRQPGPSVDDDLSVGVEGGARLQRARLSLDAEGRDDGDEADAGDVRRDGRARQHRDGDLRQRGADDARIRPEDGPAEIDRHVARDFDVAEPRLRVADGRFAREPHRERGGRRRDGADAQEGGIRLRLPGAPRQRGDEAGRGDDGEPDAGLRLRQSRQPDVEDERRERGQERDVDHVRAEIGGSARTDGGHGRRGGPQLPLRPAGPPGARRRGERGRPFHRVGRPRAWRRR